MSDAKYGEKRAYWTELGHTTPSSAGGQAKSFNQGIHHMGKLSNELENLGNVSVLGIPALSSAANTLRQWWSEDNAAVSDKAHSIGQTVAGEVGKLFSGSVGGGVHERQLTRERFDTVKSPKQLAAALEGTLEMMEGGLTALEGRRDKVLGHGSGVEFVDPETKETMTKIRDTIDRLRRGEPQPTAAAQKPPGLPQGWGVQVVR